MDPVNLTPIDSIKTPPHIQPEWYFLFAYRVLRAVPNKAGGIIALIMSVLVLFFLPFLHVGNFKGLSFYPICRLLFWCFVCNFIFLTWVGRMDVEEPFIFAGQVSTIIYFGYFILLPLVIFAEDRFMFGYGNVFCSGWFKFLVFLFLVKKDLVIIRIMNKYPRLYFVRNPLPGLETQENPCNETCPHTI